MDAKDPHTLDRATEPDDDAELRAALDELHKHTRPIDELDAETEALKHRPGFAAAIEERRRIAEIEAPPAPEPVEIASEGGALLVQAEAAATYVAPVEVAQAAPEPKAPSGPVRLRGDVDPRRLPTVRMRAGGAKGAAGGAGADAASGVHADGGAASGGQTERRAATVAHMGAASGGQMRAASGAREDGGAAREEEPSAMVGEAAGAASGDPPAGASEQVEREAASAATLAAAAAPRARTRGDLGRKRLAIGGALLFVAGAISMLVALRPPEPPDGTSASVTAPPIGSSTPPVAASALRVEAAAPTMAATPAATITETADTPPGMTTPTAPSIDGTAPSGQGAPSVMLAPKKSGDPYADAAAPSVTGAPSVAPVVTAAPSAAPVATAAPSAAPAATAPPPKVQPPPPPYEEP